MAPPATASAQRYKADQSDAQLGTQKARLTPLLPSQYLARQFHKGAGIDVGFFAHPSFVSEDELAAICGPLSIAAAETDSIFPVDMRYKSEEILKKTALPYQINLFSGVTHGFAVRCDLSDRVQKFAKEQAYCQAVAWFNQYLL